MNSLEISSNCALGCPEKLSINFVFLLCLNVYIFKILQVYMYACHPLISKMVLKQKLLCTHSYECLKMRS